MMGFVAHHAIVVTSHDAQALDQLRDTAEEIGCIVTSITTRGVNGYRSFLVAPDGSKEGWADSDEGDKQRESLKVRLGDWRYDDGSSPIEWVEVRYGSDPGNAVVVDSEWDGAA